MRPFFLAVLLCCLTPALRAAPGDTTKSLAEAKLTAKVAHLSPAERQQLRVDRCALAQTIMQDLVQQLGLTSGPLAGHVEATVARLLGTDTEAGYAEATLDVDCVDTFLTHCQGSLQRALAPVLPPAAYDCYVALLDAYGVPAR